MRKKRSRKMYIGGIVLALGIGAYAGIRTYNSEEVRETTTNISAKVKDAAKDTNEKITELEDKSLPYIPNFLKDIWNWFGNLHHEKYDSLEERYKDNVKNLDKIVKENKSH
jgi:hypothetical protein